MTPKERAAMQQALEAIGDCSPNKALVKAAYTLREALDQDIDCPCGSECIKCSPRVLLEEQAEQEPIMRKTTRDEKIVRPGVYEVSVEQAEHEPIGYIDAADLRELCNGNERQYSLFTEDKGRMVAIYAAPVRTKDLTDAELNNLWVGSTKGGWIGLFRSVIAADREKNK